MKCVTSKAVGFFFICVFGVSMLWGQRGDPEEVLSLQFSCLEWDELDTQNIYYQNGDEVITLDMSSSYRSELYNYRGPAPLIFFAESTGADGQSVRTPVARADINPSIKRALLLFVGNSNASATGEKFKVIVMDESFASFPMGTYRVFNFSEHEIGGIIGENKFIIPGKTFKTVSPQVEDMVDVQIHFSQKINDQWVPKVNTRWLFRESARNIVFVTEDFSARVPRLKVKTVTEYFNE